MYSEIDRFNGAFPSAFEIRHYFFSLLLLLECVVNSVLNDTITLLIKFRPKVIKT